MDQRWIGIVVSGEKITLVDAMVPDDGPVDIISDQTITLQKGDRAKAYEVMYHRIADYARNNGVQRAFIKASAAGQGPIGKAHLLAAELRGVAMCALAGACDVTSLTKAHVSRRFGERKTDEYVKDNDFWRDETTGQSLRIGSREAVIYMLASR